MYHLLKAMRNKIYNFLWPMIEDFFTISEPIQIQLISADNSFYILPFHKMYSEKVIKYMKRHLNFYDNQNIDIKIEDDKIKFICKNYSFKEFNKIKTNLKNAINELMRDITVHHT